MGLDTTMKEDVFVSIDIGDRVLAHLNEEVKWGVVERIVESDDLYYVIQFDSNWNTNLIEWFLIKDFRKKEAMTPKEGISLKIRNVIIELIEGIEAANIDITDAEVITEISSEATVDIIKLIEKEE